MRKKECKAPSQIACVKGKFHSIGMWSGICSSCGEQFWNFKNNVDERIKAFLELMSNIEE